MEEEDAGVVFVRSLVRRVWSSEVLPCGAVPRIAKWPVDRQDETVLSEECQPELCTHNMVLPRDVWLLVFDLLRPRELAALASACKTYRRLVLQAHRPWRRWCAFFYPELFDDRYVPEKDRPGRELQRLLVAWKSRVFVGDALIPPDLDTWMLAPKMSVVRVLVASLNQPACGKSNLIARFARGRFVGDNNRLSLALEQHTASKRMKLLDGSGVEREVLVELEECSTGLIELYAQETGCDCVVVVGSMIDQEFFDAFMSLRDRFLTLKGYAPLIVARSKSDLKIPQTVASLFRLYLRKAKIPYISTSAKMGDVGCTQVFEVAVKLATVLNVLKK